MSIQHSASVTSIAYDRPTVSATSELCVTDMLVFDYR